MIAPDTRPVSTAGMRTDVLPSETIARTFGWRLVQRREEVGEQPPRGRAEDADAHVAGDLAVDRGDVGGDLVHLAQDPAGPLDDPLPVVGEAALGAVDEQGAELALEAGDVGRHVGLHGEQGPGGGRERPVVGDRHEGGQLADVHSAGSVVTGHLRRR